MKLRRICAYDPDITYILILDKNASHVADLMPVVHNVG